MKHHDLVAIAAGVVLAVAAPVSKAAVSGRELREMLAAHVQIVASESAATEGRTQKALQLQAYVSGVFEAGLMWRRYCAPATATVGQAIAVLQAYTLTHPHPEREGQAAIATVHLALSDAYPCKRP